tara:strand:- start:235 stop:438 length:204 start_codon:yes stop_codon:yes gene_type:complete
MSQNGTVKAVPVSIEHTLSDLADLLVTRIMKGLSEDQKLSVETECADYEIFSMSNDTGAYEKVTLSP